MANNWVTDLVNECSHVESPRSWLWWSFISCISASAGNNYHLRTLKGDLHYKPNLYIILLGESGLGKGFSINRAKNIVNRAEVTRVIAGRSSIQAVVKELATQKKTEGRDLITDSRGYIVNGELSTAIIADPDALTILTDLYDGHYNPEWTNLLKGDGPEKLKNPYITCLFGSSPSHFYDSVPQVNIEGGYIGRNLIIYEEKRSQDVDLLDDSSVDETLQKDADKFDSYLCPKYIPHLLKIAKMTGQLKPDENARNYFNKWRKEWRVNQPPDKTGFLNRVPDHSLKVAMCLSLAEYDFDGYIREEHLREAIEKVSSLVYSTERTASGNSQDPITKQTKMMLDMLLECKDCECTRTVMLRKFYARGGGDATIVDRIIESLTQMGWVKLVRFGVGKNQENMIVLSGEPRDKYEQYIKEKRKA